MSKNKNLIAKIEESNRLLNEALNLMDAEAKKSFSAKLSLDSCQNKVSRVGLECKLHLNYLRLYSNLIQSLYQKKRSILKSLMTR